MTLEVRLLLEDDAAALARLMSAVEADHMTGFCLTEDEVLELMRDLPSASHEGAWDGDELVAYTTVMPRGVDRGEQRFVFFGDVHPARAGEGIGTLMLGRALQRAREAHAEQAPGVVANYVTTAYAGNDTQADLMRSFGMSEGRHSYRMVAGYDTVGEAEWPEDVTVTGFDRATGEELRAAHNTVFADYPDGGVIDEETWRGFMVTASHVRPEQSIVVWAADGSVAAYLFVHEYAVPVSGQPGREGYVPYLGTLPEHRGRGLASSMLTEALSRCRAAGLDRLCLDVDTENPTGALGIYRRAGFEQVGRRDFFHLVEQP